MKISSLANTLCRRSTAWSTIAAVATAVFLPQGPAHAGVTDRLFDFTDAYYKQNGVNPAAISGRRQPVLPNATTSAPPLASENGTRVLLTLPAYGASGEVEFWSPIGGGNSGLFTADAAGAKARQLADSFREFVFPQKGNDPLGLGAPRQSFMFDTRNGYFSNDKLALWTHVFVAYTNAAFSTKDGQKALADLTKKNGTSLDGTPIIASASDVDNLASKGFVTLTTRPFTDSLHYSICPIVNDPRNGGIAPDQFLRFVAKPDGTPLEPDFLAQFDSLQSTGQEAR